MAKKISDQNREWKLNATKVLHDWGDARDYCSDFDRILNRVGLPTRERFVQEYNMATVEVVGEATRKEFEAWKLATAKTLDQQAKRYGLNESYKEVLAKAGFPVAQTREVVIEGTFSIPMTVSVIDGEDLISQIPDNKVRDLFYDYGSSDYVTWKAVLADSQPA